MELMALLQHKQVVVVVACCPLAAVVGLEVNQLVCAYRFWQRNTVNLVALLPLQGSQDAQVVGAVVVVRAPAVAQRHHKEALRFKVAPAGLRAEA